MKNGFLLTLFMLLYIVSYSGDTSDCARDDRPKLFIDCQVGCDFNHLRESVDFIDYVNDRYLSDIYILVTNQRTGNGSEEVQLIMTDIQMDISDTIKYYNEANISGAKRRAQFARQVKKAILPVIIASDLIDELEYDVSGSEEARVELKPHDSDPWNQWSFNISGDLNINAESSSQSTQYKGRLTGSRVSAESKVNFSLFYSENYFKYNVDDGETISNLKNRYYAFAQYVISISDHWSAGIRAFGGASTFKNFNIETNIKPAIEYNVFPYSENSTRRLSFMYSVGPQYHDYIEPTIYDKAEEILARQSFDVEFAQRQDWGQIFVNTAFDQYLNMPDFYSLSFRPRMELNVMKGLTLNFGGTLSLVSDRINIAQSSTSQADVLLQIKELDTSYRYQTYTGVSYRFGSATNNIVNPRF